MIPFNPATTETQHSIGIKMAVENDKINYDEVDNPKEAVAFLSSSQTNESTSSEINVNDKNKRGIKGFFAKQFGNKEEKVAKTLKSRHITFIALGGTIGTGIFLAIGEGISYSGPAGSLVAYLVVGVFVFAVVVCLGEMASYIPNSGAFSHYGTRFVDDSFGFALGINYYLQWAFSIPSELTSAAIIIQYWLPNVASWVWAIVIIVPMFCLNLISVKTYGEAEYWFTMVKVVFIILFIIVGLLYDWGAIPTAAEPSPGLSNFRNGNAWVGGFSAWFQTIVFCFYSYGGTELVTLTSGETPKPWKSIPKAVKLTVIRIIIFMVLTCFVVGLCINHSDERLLNAYFNSDVSISPITIVFQKAGFGPAVHVVNAVLLTAVLSATNSCFFASTRMLMGMAQEGRFFPIFGVVNSRGVPMYALVLTFAISCLVFLTTIWGNAVVFTWFMNITAASAILTWMASGLISIRFHMALKKQGRPKSDLPFCQPFFPLLPILVLVLGLFLFIGMGYASTQYTPFDWKNVFGTYLGVAVFIICYLGWKIAHWGNDKFIRSENADLDTGLVWANGEGKFKKEEEKQRVKEKLYNKSINGNLWHRLRYKSYTARERLHV